ncbi:hypothetical protein AKO1_006645 [Acrasis kona]|uniref:CS domain-containing protein n=1 Tax=Acrasis kona TaxID=1008807 RepID=A0AAW2ZLL5_9EUKA
MSFYGYHLINRRDPGADGEKKQPHIVSNQVAVEVAPTVFWAQRKDRLYITVNLPGDAQADSLKFYATDNDFRIVCVYDANNLILPTDVTFTFFAPVHVGKSEYKQNKRSLVFNMIKKNAADEYWPRLFKSKDKKLWLNVDQEKITDEDEEHLDKYKWSGGVVIPNSNK